MLLHAHSAWLRVARGAAKEDYGTLPDPTAGWTQRETEISSDVSYHIEARRPTANVVRRMACSSVISYEAIPAAGDFRV